MNNLEFFEGFETDVLITDYADKFAPGGRHEQYRHGLNEVWESHKAIAQKRNILVVSASQSNQARSEKDTQAGDWAEAIMKKNLVDAGMAINQNALDKRAGIFRAKFMKQRHDDFDTLDEVTVLQCLKIGRPYLDSYTKMFKSQSQ